MKQDMDGAADQALKQALLGVKRSETGQCWVLRCQSEANISALTALGYDPVLASILAGRGVLADKAAGFLKPSLKAYLPNPSVLQDMDRAAQLIWDNIEAQKSITVFADYDVDGGTSAAQLIRWSRAVYGVMETSDETEFGLYVPDRIKEGYGPSIEAMNALKARGAELIITVDCGAAAYDALLAAQEIELPVIVIDHHMMEGERPPAQALVNPNRQDDTSGLGHMAAAGVTFLLLVALNREGRLRGQGDLPDLKTFLDLAALGTVCDVVPLTGVNRLLVTQGLKVLTARRNLGLSALADIAGRNGPMTAYDCGFVLGPRINAGGRIGEADMGAKLLSSDDLESVSEYARSLDEVNAKRKILQQQMLEEACAKAEIITKTHSMLVVAMEGWHAGVIGIIAGRLKDQFGKPAIVIGINEDGVGKGSGRSIAGVDLGGAIYRAKEMGLLQAGGGHAMAAGLSIQPDKIPEFTEFMDGLLDEDIKIATQNQTYKIDAMISASAANDSLIEIIDAASPYGSGNPQPVFAFPNLRITYAKRLNGGHVRCAFEDQGGGRIGGIAFRGDETGLGEVLLAPNPPLVHVAGRLKKDEWNGRTKIDLVVSDIALADA